MIRLDVQRVQQRERRAAEYVIHNLCDPAYVLFHAFCARLRQSLSRFGSQDFELPLSVRFGRSGMPDFVHTCGNRRGT